MSKTIMKLTEQNAIVKIVSEATTTQTITLNSDLLSPTQELSAEQNVGIQFIHWSTNGSTGNVKITRNNELIFNLFGTMGFIDLSGNGGMIDKKNSSHNIVVTVTDGGTVLLTLRKISGYESKIEPWKFGQYDDPTVVGS
jgi:hypothetical protein